MIKSKKFRKLTVALACGLIAAALVPGTAFADDEGVSGVSSDSFFASASSFFASADFGNINNYYNNLCTSFANAGWGTTSTFEVPQLSEGYASNVQELFNSSFGDLYSQVQLDTSDPLGNIDVSSFMTQAAAQRDSVVGSYTSSASYQLVANSISVGSVFSQARETKTMPSVLSNGELIELNRAGDTMAKAKAKSANSSEMEKIQNWGAAAKNNTDASNPNSEAAKMDANVKNHFSAASSEKRKDLDWDRSFTMDNYLGNLVIPDEHSFLVSGDTTIDFYTDGGVIVTLSDGTRQEGKAVKGNNGETIIKLRDGTRTTLPDNYTDYLISVGE